MALCAGIQELVWIRGVLKELERYLDEPAPFLVDYKSAQDVADNSVYHKRSKHIDIKYHWLSDYTSEYFEQPLYITARHWTCQRISLPRHWQAVCSSNTRRPSLAEPEALE